MTRTQHKTTALTALALGFAGGFFAISRGPERPELEGTKRPAPRRRSVAPSKGGPELVSLKDRNEALALRVREAEGRLAELQARSAEAPEPAPAPSNSRLEAQWVEMIVGPGLSELSFAQARKDNAAKAAFMDFLPLCEEEPEAAIALILDRLRDFEAAPMELFLALSLTKVLKPRPEDQAALTRAVLARLRAGGDPELMGFLGLFIKLDKASPPPDMSEALLDIARRSEVSEARRAAAQAFGALESEADRGRAMRFFLDPAAPEDARVDMFCAFDWERLPDAQERLLSLTRDEVIGIWAFLRLADRPPSAEVRARAEEALRQPDVSETIRAGAFRAIVSQGDRGSLALVRGIAADQGTPPGERRSARRIADQLEARLKKAESQAR